MSAAVTPQRLVPHLEAWLASDPKRAVFAVFHEGDWVGADQLVVGDRYVDIRLCPSELAVREALSEARPNGRALVLLTPTATLGQDVLARLRKPRVLRLHPHDALMHLFDVRSIDPRLVSERWLVEALIDSAPPEGYERTGSRELDADRAWRALLSHRHGLDLDGGMNALLEWAHEGRAARLRDTADEEQQAVCSRLAASMPGAEPVVRGALSGGGKDVVALGLVARSLADAPESPDRTAARTRLEPLLGDWAFEPRAARAWAEGAEDLVTASGDPQPWLQAADRWAEQLGATALAEHSDVLTGGLRQRLAAAGAALDAALTGEKDTFATALERAGRHRLADSDLVALGEHALRLLRWLGQQPASSATLREAAHDHLTDSAYADRARFVLRYGGGEPSFDAALRRLTAAADERRAEQERVFGQLLAAWVPNAASDDDLLGVEDVLERVVAPLAQQRSLLLVVLDGLSHRVACELADDLTRTGWSELRREGHPARPTVIAALPSVTNLSRASLLGGRLEGGRAVDEERRFAEHPALLDVSSQSKPPLLAHKGALPDPRGGLASTLRGEIAGDRRVVGVVVNAIDDHLARSDQLRTPWRTRDVLPLQWLLEAARDADRLVVIVSDHGHVIEWGTGLHRSSGDRGERWRSTGEAPGDGEQLVEGPRVLVGGGRCVVAVSEEVRYGPKKHGYHGGGSAQELIAPLLVLTPRLGLEHEGWCEAPDDRPAWWVGEDEASTPAPSAPPPRAEPGEQLRLDPPSGTGGSSAWIGELLASEELAAQRASAGRTPVSDERLMLILAALDARGGRMLHDALARSAQIAPLRLTGTLAALRQLLNVDGYPVLEIEGRDVVLDRDLLRAQFGLS